MFSTVTVDIHDILGALKSVGVIWGLFMGKEAFVGPMRRLFDWRDRVSDLVPCSRVQASALRSTELERGVCAVGRKESQPCTLSSFEDTVIRLITGSIGVNDDLCSNTYDAHCNGRNPETKGSRQCCSSWPNSTNYPIAGLESLQSPL